MRTLISSLTNCIGRLKTRLILDSLRNTCKLQCSHSRYWKNYENGFGKRCRTKAGFRWTKYQAASLKLRLTLGLYEIFFRNSVNVFDDQAELKKKKDYRKHGDFTRCMSCNVFGNFRAKKFTNNLQSSSLE